MKKCEKCKEGTIVRPYGKLCETCLTSAYSWAKGKSVDRIPSDRWIEPGVLYLAATGYVKRIPPGGGIAEFEHRFQMEKKLGRKLVKNESVHHVDGIRTNNNWDNLELWVGPVRWGSRASDLRCRHCGHLWSDEPEGP
jgi:hypothetical protein